MKNSNTIGQNIAVNHWLSRYPEDKTYDEIITILNESETWNLPKGIEFPEFFEDFYPPIIAGYIEELAEDIDNCKYKKSLEEVLDCPDMNHDSLEDITLEIITKAQEVLKL